MKFLKGFFVIIVICIAAQSAPKLHALTTYQDAWNVATESKFLRDKVNNFNRLYFNNEVKNIELIGFAETEEEGKVAITYGWLPYSTKVRIVVFICSYSMNNEHLDATIIHEMVHAYWISKSIDADHRDLFTKKCDQILAAHPEVKIVNYNYE